MKKILFLFGVISVFLVGCSGNSEKEEDAYFSELQNLTTISYKLASESESIAVDYLDVWRSVVFDGAVIVDGRTYTDFNDALTAKYMENSNTNVFEPVYELSADAKLSYNKLKEGEVNKYSKEFEIVRDFYLKSNELKNLSLEAKGSYNSYSDEFNEKRDELSSLYSKLKIELDL